VHACCLRHDAFRMVHLIAFQGRATFLLPAKLQKHHLVRYPNNTLTQVRRQRHVADEQRVRLIHGGTELTGDQLLPPQPCVVHCTLTSAPRPERAPPPADWVRTCLPWRWALTPCEKHVRHCLDRGTGSEICLRNLRLAAQLDAIGPRRLLQWSIGGFLAYANYSCFSGRAGIMAGLLVCVIDAAYVLTCFPQLLVTLWS
jgi:hypothetical protein